MDGFSYTDIFATKGIEYLVVIAFLLLLIPFWMILSKESSITTRLRKAFSNLSFNILNIPQGLFYGKNHTWMFMEKSGVAKVGLDDLLLHLTGEVKCLFPKSNGEVINKGDLFVELIQKGKVLRINSPVSGRIMGVNTTLSNNPATLNNDPYGNGWIYRIKPSNWTAEVQECLFAEQATKWSEKELDRVKDFLALSLRNYTAKSAMVILQDGGELCDHTLAPLSKSIWHDFEKEFLTL
jgi:glycine cleavage system H protein